MRKLDETDRKILTALVDDGRISNSDLADQVGLSKSPCWQRVKRLEDDGVIEGYTAQINGKQLGISEVIFCEISLDHHDEDVLENFEARMSEMPEILEVYLMTGEYDYLIKVAASGTTGYEAFLREKLFRIPGLRQTRSSFALKRVKQVQAFIP